MIRFLDLKAVNSLPGLNLGKIVKEVAENGWYLKGPYTRRFEQAYAEYKKEYANSPDDVGILERLGHLSLIMGNKDEAARRYLF